jgi:hypothetical protein
MAGAFTASAQLQSVFEPETDKQKPFKAPMALRRRGGTNRWG